MNVERSLAALSLAVVLSGCAAGCRKRATYVVMCPDNGSGCFAGGGRTEMQ